MSTIERHADIRTTTERKQPMRMQLILLQAEHLAKFSYRQLRAYRRNCERNGKFDEARKVVKLMGPMARAEDLRIFEWNQKTVREFLRPFMEVAMAVPGNPLTPYTEAGGFRIGRPKDHPEKLEIDSYCAFKTSSLKAVFACHVKKLGDEPTFVLELDGATYETYSSDRRDEALREWRDLAGDSATIDRLAA
jgi:hypothetical protein